MSSPAPLPAITAQQLSAASKKLAALPAVVGLDGFVDTILHVVKQRESVTKFIRSTEMRDFASAIHDSAELSTNFEFVSQMVKLDG